MLKTMFSLFFRRSSSKIVFPTRTSIANPAALSRTMSSTNEVNQSEGTELCVQHDEEQQKFFVRLDEDHEAVVQYAPTSSGAVDLWHTGVPTAFRGKGVAKVLAQAALDHFSSQKTPMRLSCSYLQRHAELYPQPKHQQYILTD